jgi:uncharacterized protein YcsI (UPF0317 family)
MNNLKIFTDPKELRAEIRQGKFVQPTSGQCPGYLQAKFVYEFPFQIVYICKMVCE